MVMDSFRQGLSLCSPFWPGNVFDSDGGFTDLSFICDISLVAAKPRWPGPGEFDPLDPAAITEVGARCEVTLDEAETKPIFIPGGGGEER